MKREDREWKVSIQRVEMGFRSPLLVSNYFLKKYSTFHMPVFSKTIECMLKITTKAVKKRAESLFELHHKWCLFLQRAAEKKTGL